jgi:SAM-dependent methyltransferase
MGMRLRTRRKGVAAFGQDPVLYDRSRPGYMPELYEILRMTCNIGIDARAVEIGTGTGQLTRGLLTLPLSHITAIEPDPRLAAFLADRYSHDPRVTVEAAKFEDVALAPASYDLIIAASSFHWLNARSGLAQAKAALKPGGWWVACWHIFNDPYAGDRFRDATAPLFADVGRVQQDDAKGVLAFGLDADLRLMELRGAGLTNMGTKVLRTSLSLTTEEILALYGTFSPITTLVPEARAHFLEGLQRLMTDQFHGRIERPLLTPVYWAQRPKR